VKWVSAHGLNNNNNKWRWRLWTIAAYEHTHSPSRLSCPTLKVGNHAALSLHSSNEPNDFSQWLWSWWQYRKCYLLFSNPQAQSQNVRFYIAFIFTERELTFTFAICYRRSVCLSSVCLSVCNVGAPYSAGWNFRQFFVAIWYLGHPLIFTENFTKIIPGELIRRGFKRKRSSQI